MHNPITAAPVPCGRQWLSALALVMMCLMPMGCLSQIMALGYLIGGPPSIEPDFDAKTGIALNKKGRKVLILCDAPKEVKWDFDSVDRELSRHVAHRLSNNKVKVMDPDAVNAWLDEHADWDTPEEIGKDFEADFVIFIEINEFGLYEQGSSQLYRGHSECVITVYQMEDGEGHEIYTKEYVSKFPLLEPVATSDQSYYDFKRLYMSRLSEEIGRHFYEHFAGDDIPHGSL
jgi:hypothetical protein